MQTIAIISPEVAALGIEKVDLIVRTLMAFDEYYKTEEPMVTDFESEWPSDYGWLRFLICRPVAIPNSKPVRTIRIGFSSAATKDFWQSA